jgi:hypothetical protein
LNCERITAEKQLRVASRELRGKDEEKEKEGLRATGCGQIAGVVE